MVCGGRGCDREAEGGGGVELAINCRVLCKCFPGDAPRGFAGVIGVPRRRPKHMWVEWDVVLWLVLALVQYTGVAGTVAVGTNSDLSCN